MSEDAKVIASGHDDGTVRRWNGNTGESMGKPMSGHTEELSCVAIRGNLIVSGSMIVCRIAGMRLQVNLLVVL